MADLAAAASDKFVLNVSGLRSIGHGTVFAISSDRLIELRARLAARWASMLTAQDRQKFQPHITIQNKVEAAEARALLALLQAGFVRFDIRAEGLSLWRYLGGPWAPVATVPLH